MESLLKDPQTLCYESHSFGSEPYEQAKVASCCGPYGDDSWEAETGDGDGDPDPYLENCEWDLAHQICLSIEERWQWHVDANHFPGDLNTQAQNFANWLHANRKACTNGFVANDVNASFQVLDSYFQFPNSVNWSDLDNFTVTVHVGNITGFSLPSNSSDRIACDSINGNDDWTFPKPWDPMQGNSSSTTLTSAMTVSLLGPLYGTSSITASEPMNSVANSCAAPWCSNATFIVDATTGEWEIGSMDLFPQTIVSLSSGSSSYNLERVRVSLFEARGYIDVGSTGTSYVIDAGDASFFVVGADGDYTASVPVFNATDIVATVGSTGTWSIGGFDLEYTDFDNNYWEINVPSSTWN